MDYSRSSIRSNSPISNNRTIHSNDLTIDVLVDYTKRLYSAEKTKILDEIINNEDKICKLYEIIFGIPADKKESNRDIRYMLDSVKDKLSDIAAKRYIEEGIKKEIIRRMQTREKEYLDEMKLQIIKKHTTLENASTLKKFAELEKLKCVKLSKSVLEAIRPSTEKEIIGQQDAISSLISKIASPFPQHVILYGPPGVGKTTAARIALDIAKKRKYTPFQREAKFVEVDATTLRWDPRESVNPLIGSVHDPIYQGASKELAELGIPEPKPGLVTEAHGGVLFIDEIGELDAMFQNKLLKVLEDKKVNFDSSYFDINNESIPQYISTLFKEGAPADFVLIGATTRTPEEINPALRSRCAAVYFNPLDSGHITEIVKSAADKLDINITHENAELISNFTFEARKAVNILADCYSSVVCESDSDGKVEITEAVIRQVLSKGRMTPVNKALGSSKREVGKLFGVGVNGFLGSIIEFEAVCFDNEEGNGRVRFNDTAGSMTKDSLFNAISVLRSITGKKIENYDVHVNYLGGARVDGPSAGAALTCLVYSVVENRAARQDTCITGEISIRGDIKPVGGVVEKVNAAKRYGFNSIIIPADNKDETVHVKGINIIAAGNIQEVIKHMFE
ncbi:MAG: Lon family ATP-dependent protease [Bacillota bacterium]